MKFINILLFVCYAYVSYICFCYISKNWLSMHTSLIGFTCILCPHKNWCSIQSHIYTFIKAFHFKFSMLRFPTLFFFSGTGIYILYKDVKSCPCEDVQVLWSILVESRTPSLPSTWWSCLSCPIANHKSGRFHFMYIYKYYIILTSNPFTFCCLPNYEPYVPFSLSVYATFHVNNEE
jgi:hypothetical protein